VRRAVEHFKLYKMHDWFYLVAMAFLIVGAITDTNRVIYTGIALFVYAMILRTDEKVDKLGDRITRLETRLREKGMLDG
jgi:hypothetical protein